MNAQPFDVLHTGTVREAALGQEYVAPDGRKYRYAKAGASAMAAGKLGVAPAPKTNHDNMAVVSAVAIGGTQVTVTLGATAAVANEYAEGFFVVNAGTGIGQVLRVASHPAADSAANLVVTLEHGLVVALDTTSKVCLVYNPCNGVVESASSPTTLNVVGVPNCAVTATYYYWAQFKGVCPLYSYTTTTLGNDMILSANTAGYADNAEATTLATNVAQVKVAKAMTAGVAANTRPVMLNIL